MAPKNHGAQRPLLTLMFLMVGVTMTMMGLASSEHLDDNETSETETEIDVVNPSGSYGSPIYGAPNSAVVVEQQVGVPVVQLPIPYGTPQFKGFQRFPSGGVGGAGWGWPGPQQQFQQFQLQGVGQGWGLPIPPPIVIPFNLPQPTGWGWPGPFRR